MTSPLVTVGIPLYRSAPFVGNVSATIEALPTDVEVLISDRHRHDSAIDELRRRHSGDARVRFSERLDGRDWVEHLNDLMREAKGRYWRFMPHDDFTDRKSFEALIECLEGSPEALLAYGPTTASDAAGTRLPHLDTPAPHPVYNDAPWFLGLALDCFSRGHFNGAFKGLIRRRDLAARRLWIRRTRGGVYAERAWLSALALIGRFQFVENAAYWKRYHSESVHARWPSSGQWPFEWSVRRQLLGYFRDLLPDPALFPPARGYLTWVFWARLGWVPPPRDLPVAEPFLPGRLESVRARLLASLPGQRRGEWRSLHGFRHLEGASWGSRGAG
ncbi:MAG: glycosyltransferase [Acidobacteriota bacterium]